MSIIDIIHKQGATGGASCQQAIGIRNQYNQVKLTVGLIQKFTFKI